MSMHMLNQLHNAKLSEIGKEGDERIPLANLPKSLQRDITTYHAAQDSCSRLSRKIREAGYDPESGRDGLRRPYDWRNKEKTERRQAASTLRTMTHIALMKCVKATERGVVMERYVKALKSI